MYASKISPWAIADTLEELVSLAWTTFIGSDIVRVDARDIGPQVVCASISISGPSCATVLFFADPALARWATSIVLDSPAEDLDDADIHDVLGEIVNIIGGNVKGVVSDGEQEWALSLPVVSNAMQSAPGSRPAALICFVAEAGTMGCQILEHG
ncbi:MAG: hypothetical protein JWN39_4231 [Ilumatobacteraceae bacterium]|nr:hypothetical protein [Ilumatobacteraceae bacterium]